MIGIILIEYHEPLVDIYIYIYISEYHLRDLYERQKMKIRRLVLNMSKYVLSHRNGTYRESRTIIC
jgi:hypothetical protein